MTVVWDRNDNFAYDANLHEVCVAVKAKIQDVIECTSAVYSFVAKVSANTSTVDG